MKITVTLENELRQESFEEEFDINDASSVLGVVSAMLVRTFDREYARLNPEDAKWRNTRTNEVIEDFEG